MRCKRYCILHRACDYLVVAFDTDHFGSICNALDKVSCWSLNWIQIVSTLESRKFRWGWRRIAFQGSEIRRCWSYLWIQIVDIGAIPHQQRRPRARTRRAAAPPPRARHKRRAAQHFAPNAGPVLLSTTTGLRPRNTPQNALSATRECRARRQRRTVSRGLRPQQHGSLRPHSGSEQHASQATMARCVPPTDFSPRPLSQDHQPDIRERRAREASLLRSAITSCREPLWVALLAAASSQRVLQVSARLAALNGNP